MGKPLCLATPNAKYFNNKVMDVVEIEMGGTSLKFQANSFYVMHEILRKAAARIVMQTEI
ncbi:MAG: hypothetical protein WBC07_02280 [Methylotenera sp.]